MFVPTLIYFKRFYFAEGINVSLENLPFFVVELLSKVYLYYRAR
jgi:hypothetical protein